MSTVSGVTGRAARIGPPGPFHAGPVTAAAVQAAVPLARGGTAVLLLALVAPVVLQFGWGPLPTLLVVLTLGVVTLGLEWEALVALMLGTMFFLGPLKLGFGGWIAYAVPDALGALVLLRWMAQELANGGRALRRHPLTVPMFVLGCYLVLELANPTAPLLRSLFGLRSWLMYTALIFVGYAGFRTDDQVERVYRVLWLLGVITGAYGIWQWYGGPNAVRALGGAYAIYAEGHGTVPWEMTAEGPVFRAVSTFMSATMFANNMAFVALTSISLVLCRRSGTLAKVVYLGGVCVMLGAIATTGSRLGLVYLMGSGLVIAWLFKTPRILLGLAPLALVGIEIGRAVTLGSMGKRFSSVLEPDTFFWKWFEPFYGGVMIGTESPIGRGIGYTAGVPQYADAAVLREISGALQNTIDSGYGAVAAELGVVGLPIFVWFVVVMALATLRAWRAIPVPSRSLFIAPTIWGMTFPLYLFLGGWHAALPSSAYFWLLIGMLLRAGHMAGDARVAEPTPSPPARGDGGTDRG